MKKYLQKGSVELIQKQKIELVRELELITEDLVNKIMKLKSLDEKLQKLKKKKSP